MKRRYLQPLSLALAMAFTLAGIRAHLSAQEAKPMPAANARPDLRQWIFPGMIPKSNWAYPQVAAAMGDVNADYADIFDFYAKKMGCDHYNLKELTTFQPPNHSLITSLGAGMDTTSPCYIDSQVIQVTLSKRTTHEYVTVNLIRTKQSKETFISLTSTTF